MNKRNQKIQDKILKKKAEAEAVAEQPPAEKPKPIFDSNGSEVDSIVHRNLFEIEAYERKHFYKEGKFRPKDLRGSRKDNPRLRTKTRSKQKNLRKDNRTAEEKKAKGIEV